MLFGQLEARPRGLERRFQVILEPPGVGTRGVHRSEPLHFASRTGDAERRIQRAPGIGIAAAGANPAQNHEWIHAIDRRQRGTAQDAAGDLTSFVPPSAKQQHARSRAQHVHHPGVEIAFGRVRNTCVEVPVTGVNLVGTARHPGQVRVHPCDVLFEIRPLSQLEASLELGNSLRLADVCARRRRC
jgi:hypothetical protein